MAVPGEMFHNLERLLRALFGRVAVLPAIEGRLGRNMEQAAHDLEQAGCGLM